MRALTVLLLLTPALLAAQPKARKTMTVGAVRTVPSGTRFALGTPSGTVSVETKGATFLMGGRPAKFSDLRLGSSVTVLGTVTTPAAGVRATIAATRVEIARTPVPTSARSGTTPRRTALKRA